MTDHEIHLFSVRRCGTHAVAWWLLGMTDRWCLRRNCDFNNPGRDRLIKWGGLSEEEVMREKAGQPQDKDLLLLTYEDVPPKKFPRRWEKMLSAQAPAKGVRYFGQPARRRVVYMLRDPFNLLASVLKRKHRPIDPQACLNLWKLYAREAAGETNHFPHNAVFISYNAWFSSSGYRLSIAHKLGLPYSDRNLNVVTDHGTGSSFDGTKFDGNAQDMHVLNRWNEFAGQAQYRQLLADPELRRLSELIFGRPPF